MAGTNSREITDLPPAPAVILVAPQLGENIGMTARAMLNCGLTDLRLVAPKQGWPNPKATAAASGADRVLETARVYPTTRAAVADLQRVYATTARPRGLVKEVLTPRAAAAAQRSEMAAGQGVGLLFGPERTGLENDDIALARRHRHGAAQSRLQLAQPRPGRPAGRLRVVDGGRRHAGPAARSRRQRPGRQDRPLRLSRSPGRGAGQARLLSPAGETPRHAPQRPRDLPTRPAQRTGGADPAGHPLCLLGRETEARTGGAGGEGGRRRKYLRFSV